MEDQLKKSLVSKELTDLGYHTDQQRRGLVKWINSILSVLLFVSVSANFLQWKSQLIREESHAKEISNARDRVDQLNEKYNDIFLQMLNAQKRTEQKLDTAQNVIRITQQLVK